MSHGDRMLTRLMQTYPDCHFSYGSANHRDVWALCHLHGPLPSGMTPWLATFGLEPHRRIGLNGYEIRWKDSNHFKKASDE